MGSIIYMATGDGVLVVRQKGDRWETEQKLAGVPTDAMAVDPLAPERVYCGSAERGLWRSQDAGATWQPAGSGIAPARVMSITVSRNERPGGIGVVYAGTEPSGLYRSEDGGDSWEDVSSFRSLPSAPTWRFPPKPYTNHVRAVALDTDTPGKLYVAIEAGALIRSTDGGRTWVDRVPDGPFDSHTLATHTLAPGRVYSAAGDGFMNPGMGYLESLDGGESWQRKGEGLRHHYLWGLALHPADPDTILVSAAHGPREAHNTSSAESAVYRRSRDQPWQQVTEGLPPEKGTLAFTLAAGEAEPGVFYAASNTGLYRSEDAGLSWRRLEVEWPNERGSRPGGLAVAIEQ